MKDITPPPTPPFCVQCAYFIEPFSAGNETGDQHRCRKFQMLDVVMGEPFFVPCSHVREPNAPCGTEGKLFQPKPSEPTAN
jgi:hypothetical protein